ncbi:hypothetical protein TUM19329_32120 [Legionella antarctica]|uniref:Uncharacterized protein n=1 Tax=Legionella antarctica TaxID=2708020 RepID=A0A6F8T8S3_9GAMM|nr:hypothetical protein TUM19329_32120 [Legionella antarctica]
MVFGIINTAYVNTMGLRAREFGLMVIGSVEVIALVGYVPVGTGLAAIGQIDLIGVFIEEPYLDKVHKFMSKNKNTNMNMVMESGIDIMNMGVPMNKAKDMSTDIVIASRLALMLIHEGYS